MKPIYPFMDIADQMNKNLFIFRSITPRIALKWIVVFVLDQRDKKNIFPSVTEDYPSGWLSNNYQII